MSCGFPSSNAVHCVCMCVYYHAAFRELFAGISIFMTADGESICPALFVPLREIRAQDVSFLP